MRGILSGGDIDTAVYGLRARISTDEARHGGFNSTHEALGVLLEEFNELQDAIRANAIRDIAKEAIQVSAVALRLNALCLRAERGDANDFFERSGFSRAV